MVVLPFLLLLSSLWRSSAAFAFVASSRQRTTRQFLSQNDNMNEEERMEAVRSLQNSFYDSNEDEDTPFLDENTGIMHNLSLWRVGWVELPGRSNVLNVHEGQYTHMFEQILRGPEPWYVGHLYLQGGSKNLKVTPLVTWRDTTPRSAQVGCLMRIRDYRRMRDGRLTILVQVLERFVVDTVLQSLPYSKAHVQILPDIPVDENADENFARIKRAKQVRQSFQYHAYEFDNTKLPYPQSDFMDTNMDFGVELMQVLPFSFYSKDESLLNDIAEKDDTDSSLSSFDGGTPSLECQLLGRNILKEPASLTKTADASETLIWLALEAYSRSIRMPLPEQVLCLKPPEMDYLDLTDAVHPLSPRYPKSRRQHRLSYTAAGFLGNHLWQVLLELSSTEARLEAVLLQFQRIQDAMEGEFQ